MKAIETLYNGYKAIPTVYDGYKFRSRTEARWAVFFNALGIPYKYEIDGFDLDGTWYLPDFWLTDQQCWIEVKGQEPTEEEIDKARLLAIYTQKPVYIFSGDVWVPQSADVNSDDPFEKSTKSALKFGPFSLYGSAETWWSKYQIERKMSERKQECSKRREELEARLDELPEDCDEYSSLLEEYESIDDDEPVLGEGEWRVLEAPCHILALFSQLQKASSFLMPMHKGYGSPPQLYAHCPAMMPLDQLVNLYKHIQAYSDELVQLLNCEPEFTWSLTGPDGSCNTDCYYWWTECPLCHKFDMALLGHAPGMPCGCLIKWADETGNSDELYIGRGKYRTYKIPRLIAAYTAARQARFEHGERGGKHEH